jgi:enoyl-[acyl-carrier-protein] reductase (NADH)
VAGYIALVHKDEGTSYGVRSIEGVRAAAMAEQSIKAKIDPKDIAGLAVFLASDAAKSISGQVLPIDNDRQRA